METKQEQKTETKPIILSELVDSLQDQYLKEARAHGRYVNLDSMLTLSWCCMKLIRLSVPQPRNFDEMDKTNADSLKARGCSMQEIAFVLDRSKSSVCEYFKQDE
jgi:hypothetical protein